MCIIVSIVLLLAVSAMSSASDTVGSWNRNITEIDFANGDRYQGNTEVLGKMVNAMVPCANVLMHGYGKYTWADGDFYEGEYQDCLKHGKGKFSWADGEFYDGGYQDNEKHGSGEYSWANGDVYEGEFQYGKIHGYGKFTWADGRVYEGEFQDGKIHSSGWANGIFFIKVAIYIGIFLVHLSMLVHCLSLF